MSTEIQNARTAQLIADARACIEAVRALVALVQKSHPIPKSEEFKLAERASRTVMNAEAAIADLEDEHVVEEKSASPSIFSGRGTTTTHRHESFGAISIHRISGFARLFGSVLDAHQHFIRITIQRAQFEQDAFDAQSRIWPSNKIVDHIVEVDLSAAQWAEAITNMNVGVGNPCTLRVVRGRQMSPVPDTHEDRATRILDEFRERMKSAPAEARQQTEQLVELIMSSGLSKKKQEEMLAAARKIAPAFEHTVPFVLKQFDEAAEKSVAAVKSEVDASISMIATKLGLAEMRRRAALPNATEETILALPEEPKEGGAAS